MIIKDDVNAARALVSALHQYRLTAYEPKELLSKVERLIIDFHTAFENKLD